MLLSSHTSTLYGNVVGSVYGDDSAAIIDGITSTVVGTIKTANTSFFDGEVKIARNVTTDPKFNYYSTTHGAFSDSVLGYKTLAIQPYQTKLVYLNLEEQLTQEQRYNQAIH